MSLPIAFLDVGGGELILVFLVVLLMFGGKRMPEIARTMGKTVRELKKATGAMENEIRKAMDEVEKEPVKLSAEDKMKWAQRVPENPLDLRAPIEPILPPEPPKPDITPEPPAPS